MHNCDLSLCQKLFTIGEQQVRCVPQRTKATRAKLKLARRVEVPPHTEVVVKCQATSNVKPFDTPLHNLLTTAGDMPRMVW